MIGMIMSNGSLMGGCMGIPPSFGDRVADLDILSASAARGLISKGKQCVNCPRVFDDFH